MPVPDGALELFLFQKIQGRRAAPWPGVSRDDRGGCGGRVGRGRAGSHVPAAVGGGGLCRAGCPAADAPADVAVVPGPAGPLRDSGGPLRSPAHALALLRESRRSALPPPCSGRLAWGTQRRRALVRRDGAGTALTLRSAGLSVWALQKKQGTGLKGKSPGKVQDGCGCSDGLRACAPALRGARGLCVRIRGRSAGLGRRVWTAEGAGDARGSLASGPDGLVPRGQPATRLRGHQSPPH